MFCAKCGHEHLGDAKFCAQCGASLTLEEVTSEEQNSSLPITKKEYFINHCSASTKQKKKTIKFLSIISLAIQSILAVLLIISLGVLSYTIEQSFVLEDSPSSLFGSLIILQLFYAGSSFIFTILGIKKNSTGFFVTATFFAFFSATYSSRIFNSLALRQLIGFGTLAIYIVIDILNYQSNKDYKEYISQYIATKNEDKKYIPPYFTTNKKGGIKKSLVLAIVIVLLFVFVAFALSSYSTKNCHRCGDSVGSDPVKAAGRTYCSYDCYMDEVFF